MSRPLDLDDFEEALEWDPEEWERGNLAHCLEHGIDEQVVDEVLYGEWVNVELPVDGAEFAIVGPNSAWNFMWTLLFAPSRMRGTCSGLLPDATQVHPRLGNGRE